MDPGIEVEGSGGGRVINAPVLNIFLGWPLQLLGLLMAPYLAVRDREQQQP